MVESCILTFICFASTWAMCWHHSFPHGRSVAERKETKISTMSSLAFSCCSTFLRRFSSRE